MNKKQRLEEALDVIEDFVELGRNEIMKREREFKNAKVELAEAMAAYFGYSS